MPGGLGMGWMGDREVNLAMLKPFQVLRVGSQKGLPFSCFPSPPLEKDGGRAIFAIGVYI